MTTGNERAELRARVEARREELKARLKEAEANVRGSVNEAADATRKRLAELKETLADGWENLTEQGARKLNEWLKR